MSSMKLILSSAFRSILTIISPKLNTKVTYRIKFKRKLDLVHPKTLNEKILYLKFHDYWNNQQVKDCADKYAVRSYIEEAGSREILNDLIGVYATVDEIPWETLPNKVVLKLNVGCGCNAVIMDKKSVDKKQMYAQMHKWLKKKHYLGYSEMQYKGVKPYILAEKFLGDEYGNLPEDYKFYCMNGIAKYVMVCLGRGIEDHPRFYYYDREWNLMPFSQDAIAEPNINIPKPDMMDEAFKYAEKLSKPFLFVRCDLYIVKGKVYFGELTFTPSAGQDSARLRTTDEILGDELSLSIDK